MSRALALLLLLAVGASGCSQLLGTLRRDLDDYPPEPAFAAGPTAITGGRWSERGMLEDGGGSGPGYYEERNAFPAHAERAPASADAGRAPTQQDSWVSHEQADSNRRDQYRYTDVDPRELGPSASTVANLAPPVKRLYKSGDRATKADFVDDTPADGSLWASDGQTNYYFTKNKVRGPGDIVTLNLEQAIVTDMINESKRTLAQNELDKELGVIQERINAQYLPLIQKAEAEVEAKKLAEKEEKEKKKDGADRVVASQAAPTAAPAAAPQEVANANAAGAAAANSITTLLANENGAILPPGTKTTKLVVGDKEYVVPKADPNEINLTPLLEVKTGEPMMTEIAERYPNGNYKIRGIKKINYKNGPPRLVQVTGIVKGTDISEEDVTSSGKLYEYRVEALR